MPSCMLPNPRFFDLALVDGPPRARSSVYGTARLLKLLLTIGFQMIRCPSLKILP